MNPEKLLAENFKLNRYEARVYVALVSGRMTPKQVSEVAQVPLSRTYDTLHSLQRKGFVEERGEAFSAISAKAALRMRLRQFEEEFSRDQGVRLEALDSLLDALGTRRRTEPVTNQEVSLLRGINAIASKFSEVITDSDDVLLVIKKSFDAKEFFKPYLEKRKAKTVRILIPSGLSLPGSDASFLRKMGLQVRRTDNLFLDLMVSDDSTVVIGVPDPTSEEAYHSIAVVISSVPFAKALRSSLEEVWNRAS